MRRVLNGDWSALNAGLFIAATNIGISYFSLPILTGTAGFIPAIIATFVVWGFTLSVALLFIEATLGQPDGSNIVSITKALLGKVWMVIISVVFLINMISYLTAYVFFTQKTVQWFSEHYFHMHIPFFLNTILSTIPFFLIIYFGISFACKMNALLAIALLLSFFMTIAQGKEFIVSPRLVTHHWEYVFFSIPLLFSALGFVGVGPPICTYLKRDPNKLRKAVWIGTCIPLIVYLIWQWFVIGTFTTGTFWLLYEEGIDTERVLELFQKFPTLTQSVNFTLFFSMITSLIGNGIGTVEFLCDGFDIPLRERKGWKRALICILLMVSIMSFSWIEGRPFLALIQNFTAPLGEVLINGIIPVWMVAQARYFYKIKAPKMLPGKHISLLILGVGIFILIYLEGIEFIRS